MDTDETVVRGGGSGWQFLPAETMLDNYRIERLIGRGGMGTVYLAKHVSLKKHYAVKVLPDGLSRDLRFRERFQEEERRMASLEHPGVVRIHNAGVSDGRHYFAMEYLSGGDLEQLLHARGGRIAEAEVREVLAQVLQTLVYAHGRGVIHRDLKPANILLDGKPEAAGKGKPLYRVKITDFGLAQVVGDGYMKSLVQQTVAASVIGGAETQIGQGSGGQAGAPPGYAGTIYFMAPELVSGGSGSVQTDLYAIGVVGYYLLTGRKPIGRYADATKVVAGLSPDWDEWLNHMMQSECADRMPDAQTALARLPSLRDKRKVSASRIEPAPDVENLRPKPLPAVRFFPDRVDAGKDEAAWRRLRLLWITVAAVLIIIGSLAVAYNLLRPSDTGESVITATDSGAHYPAEPRVVAPATPPLIHGRRDSAGDVLAVALPGGIGMELVAIQPGQLVLGSPAGTFGFGGERGRLASEGPQTTVRLTRDFWLGRYPVTQEQWQTVMGKNPSAFSGRGLGAPVENVSWEDAMAFCHRVTELETAAGRLPQDYVYTLPSEVEWEYAARAGTATAWAFGDDPRDLEHHAWYLANSSGGTQPVGQLRPNPLGIHDLYGNVWEWTRSWFGNYPGGRQTDYHGPATGTLRTLRGGAWDYSAASTRSAVRNWARPTQRQGNTGFRVALVHNSQVSDSDGSR